MIMVRDHKNEGNKTVDMGYSKSQFVSQDPKYQKSQGRMREMGHTRDVRDLRASSPNVVTQRLVT
jgi:hypothetical protein